MDEIKQIMAIEKSSFSNDQQLFSNGIPNYYDFFVQKLNSEVISYLVYHVLDDRTVEIISLATDGKFRNTGQADLLMTKFLKCYRSHTITLDVAESNRQAIKLYEKYNFKIVAKRRNMYGENDGLLLILEVNDENISN